MAIINVKVFKYVTDGVHGSLPMDKDGIPFVSSKDIKNGIINLNTKLVSKLVAQKHLNRIKIFPDNILITNSGTLGEIAIIPYDIKEFILQKSVAVCKVSDTFIPKYIYYWLISHKKELLKLGQGSAQKNILLKDLRLFSIKSISFKKQKQIIDIIEPIEKIENNIFMQINKINFFLKNIKTTNQEIKLSDIFEPIKNNPKNLEQVSAKVLIKNNTLISNLEKKGTYTTNSFFCPEGTFLFCSIRTYLQKYCLLPIDADVNGTLFQFKIKNNFTSLLKALKNKNFWEETILLSTGTKMPVISKKDFLNIKIKKTKFEIENLDKLLIIQNKILMKLTKLKENIVNLLIK